MTPDPAAEFRAFRLNLNWSQEWVAEFFGVSERTVRNWETSGAPIPQSVWMLVLAIDWNYLSVDQINDVSSGAQRRVRAD